MTAYTQQESQYVSDGMGKRWPTALVPHLAGVCVDNEMDLPRPTEFVRPKIEQGRLMQGYVLFPSRASKGIEVARRLANQLKLPLVGNASYSVGGAVDASIDFDRFNPYKGAKLMVTVTRHDSYNIGIAKAIAQGVPSVWDNGNIQIQSIWSEFPMAIPRGKFKGQGSLDRAMEHADECKARLQTRIGASLSKFQSAVGV